MTFDDDFIQIEGADGRRVGRWSCKEMQCDWPPPTRVRINGVPYRRVSFSNISDEDRAAMTKVKRGALYVPAPLPTGEGK